MDQTQIYMLVVMGMMAVFGGSAMFFSSKGKK